MTALLCTVGFPVLATAPQTRMPLSLNSSSVDPSLIEQSKTLYDSGQYAEAVKVLEQAASAFETQGDKLRQAMTLSNLSLAYQQLGSWSRATAAIEKSLKLLQTDQNIKDSKRTQVLAQALDTQGSLQLSLGQAENALSTWNKAATTYAKASDPAGVTRSRINSVQAMQSLGLFLQAQKTLTELNKTLNSTPDSLPKALGLRSLGNVLRLVGDLDKASENLQQSLAIAERLQSPQDISAALFSLGNIARAKQEIDVKAALESGDNALEQQDTKTASTYYQKAASAALPALEYYQKAAAASPSPAMKIQAQLNQLSLLVETKQWGDAEDLWPQIQSQITQLPPNRTAVYAKVNFAESLMKIGSREQGAGGREQEASGAGSKQESSPSPQPPAPSPSSIAQLLATAVQEARSLQDQRAESYAVGTLGELYEHTKQWPQAKDLTEQALLISQSIEASDIAYLWQWQLGRILKSQGDTQGAIASYTQAVDTLKSLRGDLVAINRSNIEFSFRESVEPVYRELVGLLLESDQTKDSSKNNNLDQARNVFESLQEAELVNYFRSECLNATPVALDQVIDKDDPTAAVIYPIILRDRLEVIVKLPQQTLRRYRTAVTRSELDKTISDLSKTLVTRTSREYLPFSQKVYDWLLRPAEADIANSKVKTLVFVLDGSLRNIPMSALYDGKQYLLEKYGVAITPGLQLLNPQRLKREQLRALTAGITEARDQFPALSNVAFELQQIKSEVPSSVELLNQQFTAEALQKELKAVAFPVVHIASHSQFSSVPEQTFILAWDGRINVSQLDSLLRVREQDQRQRSAIELLVLSACRTVAGDKRAALGLAGVAVRAGARSTLATLWNVNDRAIVALMTEFYKELANNNTVTKAEALRHAQQTLLKNPEYRHPVDWAAYVLVGNWL